MLCDAFLVVITSRPEIHENYLRGELRILQVQVALVFVRRVAGVVLVMLAHMLVFCSLRL